MRSRTELGRILASTAVRVCSGVCDDAGKEDEASGRNARGAESCQLISTIARAHGCTCTHQKTEPQLACSDRVVAVHCARGGYRRESRRAVTFGPRTADARRGDRAVLHARLVSCASGWSQRADSMHGQQRRTFGARIADGASTTGDDAADGLAARCARIEVARRVAVGGSTCIKNAPARDV